MDAFKIQLFSLKSESFGGFQILDNYGCIKTSKLFIIYYAWCNTAYISNCVLT